MTPTETAGTPAPVQTDAAPAVPLVDLRPQMEEVAADLHAAVSAVIDSGAFVLGPAVEEFERFYASYCRTTHCVGVGNGTDAIELALRGAGVGPGDEVIVPANTFVATAEAVVRAGATLVLADCDESFLVDPQEVEARRGPRTRAVIGVDLYGQIAPFERLREAAGDDVLLLEDAAQSQGATRFGQSAGSLGAAASTSFYPGKNLGAIGDAGAVTTDSAEIAERVRELRNHGGTRRYEHRVVGTNSRLDSIQAAALGVKLARLPRWNDQRREAADRYAELLGDLDQVILPRVAAGNQHVWHLYVIRVADREEVSRRAQEAGVGVGLHYPRPVHQLPAFAGMGLGQFPVAERLAREILTIPLFPGITPAQQERVCDVLRAATHGAAAPSGGGLR